MLVARCQQFSNSIISGLAKLWLVNVHSLANKPTMPMRFLTRIGAPKKCRRQICKRSEFGHLKKSVGLSYASRPEPLRPWSEKGYTQWLKQQASISANSSFQLSRNLTFSQSRRFLRSCLLLYDFISTKLSFLLRTLLLALYWQPKFCLT